MLDYITQIIDLIELGNLISILFFILSTIIAFYFYFKSFYRIVYSTAKICERKDSHINWKNKKNTVTTRVIFYNNGRKTITNNEIRVFKLKASSEISNTYILNGINHFDIIKKEKELNIKISSLDTNKYFVIEVTHKGILKIEGEISETGSFLNTETKTWVIINITCTVFLFSNLIYNLLENSDINGVIIDYKAFGFNLFLTMLSVLFIRFIHKIFFIPDGTVVKYLETNESNMEFKDNYY